MIHVLYYVKVEWEGIFYYEFNKKYRNFYIIKGIFLLCAALY